MQNQWAMAKVIDVFKSNDDHLRTVKLRVGDNKFTENGSKYLVRTIDKILWLFENDEVQFPNVETYNSYNHDDESSWGEPYVVDWVQTLNFEQGKFWTLNHLISNIVITLFLCEIFRINCLRGKYNKRSAATFMMSIAHWILLWGS